MVGLGRKIQAWRTPSTPGTDGTGELDFAPFVLHRDYGGHFADVQALSWSSDSRFFVSASKDLTARIWSLDPEEGFGPTVLAGHREGVRNVWFSKSQESIYTVSRDGALFRWEYVPRPQTQGGQSQPSEDKLDERWRIVQREYFMQSNAKLKCACFHPSTNLLTVCFNNGLFSIYELPSFANIHTLSIASSPISNVAINKSGEWLAFGSAKTGQLLVWEHASESHILKQSSHLDTLTTLSFSHHYRRRRWTHQNLGHLIRLPYRHFHRTFLRGDSICILSARKYPLYLIPRWKCACLGHAPLPEFSYLHSTHSPPIFLTRN